MAIPNLIDSTEIWKDVPGFEQQYQVSNFGHICGKSRTVNVNGGSWVKPSQIMKNGITSHGYPHITLCISGKKHTCLVHRLVMWAFVGPQEKGMEVNHIDGNKTNNHIANLEYLSRSDNTIHAFRTGLMTRKRRLKNCKLTDEQVREIRRGYIMGEYNPGKKFGYRRWRSILVAKGEMYSWVE